MSFLSIVWSHDEKTELTKSFKLTHLNKVVVIIIIIITIIIIIITIIIININIIIIISIVVVVVIVIASSLGFRRLLMFLQ